MTKNMVVANPILLHVGISHQNQKIWCILALPPYAAFNSLPLSLNLISNNSCRVISALPNWNPTPMRRYIFLLAWSSVHLRAIHLSSSRLSMVYDQVASGSVTNWVIPYALWASPLPTLTMMCGFMPHSLPMSCMTILLCMLMTSLPLWWTLIHFFRLYSHLPGSIS